MEDGGSFAEHVLDLIVRVGPPFDTCARLRRMFGGHGIFCDGVMFALISDDTLYFKADDNTKPAFLDAGSLPFTYEKAGREIELSYLTVPDEAGEDVEELRNWAHMALAAANRAHAKIPNLAAGKPAKPRNNKRS